MHIEQTTLGNGLVVLTSCSPQLDSASFGAYVNVGARQETAANNGISHFCEHMAFKGTSQRSAYDIAEQIEVLGSDVNAFTSMDMTAFHSTGLATQIDPAIAILGDVLTDSLFASSDIALESGVIVQEINRHADNPSGVMYDTLQALSYPAQPLGRTILGSLDFVTSATTTDFKTFTGKYYTADNMVIAGAGGFGHDVFVRRVETAFASLPSTAHREPPQIARYVGGVTVDRDREFKQVSAAIAFESVTSLDERMYHHILLADAFGAGMSSPLFVEVREKRGLVYSTGCYAALNPDHGRVVIYGGMTAQNVESFIAVACHELRRLCDDIRPTDLHRAKNMYFTQLATLKEKPYATAGFMARSFWQRGYVRSLAEMHAAVDIVTIADLRIAAQELVGSVPSIAIVGPAPDLDYQGMVTKALT